MIKLTNLYVDDRPVQIGTYNRIWCSTESGFDGAVYRMWYRCTGPAAANPTMHRTDATNFTANYSTLYISFVLFIFVSQGLTRLVILQC